MTASFGARISVALVAPSRHIGLDDRRGQSHANRSLTRVADATYDLTDS